MATKEQLRQLYGQLQEQNIKVYENERYVIGQNPAILDRKQKKSPDNRIITPLGKMATEQMSGYAGRAGDKVITYDLITTETADDNDDPFISYMLEMDKYNKQDIETSELYGEALGQGESYELWWTSDKKLPGGLLTSEYKIVPNEEIIIQYSADLKKEMESFVHYTQLEEDEIQATVYYPEYKEIWISKDGGEFSLIEDDVRYPFKTPPLIVYKGNRRSMPLFESEKGLIKTVDELVSKKQNEVDRFADAILLISQAVDKIFKDKLVDSDITVIDKIESMEGGIIPQYLEKNLTGTTEYIKTQLDFAIQQYWKSVGVADMTAESFGGGDQSGYAIMLKLLPMEHKASLIDTYFNQGLQQRKQFYADVYNASTFRVDEDEYEMKIESNRNLPADLKLKAEILQILLQSGLPMSKGLKIRSNPLIQDEKAALEELKRLEEEAETEPIDLMGDNPLEAS